MVLAVFVFLVFFFLFFLQAVNTIVVHPFTAFTTFLLFDDKDDFIYSKKTDCSSADLPDPARSDCLRDQPRGNWPELSRLRFDSYPN